MRTLAVALLGGLLAAAPALAQKPPAKEAAAKAPAYDTKAEVTITGVVDDLHESKLRTDHPGLHLIVKTETEAVEVHTCPVRFMKDLEFTVEKGDTVTIVGSRPGGVGIVLAREIKKGQTSLSVRDKAGVPVWTR
jgi:ABC-type glutathione transport system ATPase component